MSGWLSAGTSGFFSRPDSKIIGKAATQSVDLPMLNMSMKPQCRTCSLWRSRGAYGRSSHYQTRRRPPQLCRRAIICRGSPIGSKYGACADLISRRHQVARPGSGPRPVTDSSSREFLTILGPSGSGNGFDAARWLRGTQWGRHPFLWPTQSRPFRPIAVTRASSSKVLRSFRTFTVRRNLEFPLEMRGMTAQREQRG